MGVPAGGKGFRPVTVYNLNEFLGKNAISRSAGSSRVPVRETGTALIPRMARNPYPIR